MNNVRKNSKYTFCTAGVFFKAVLALLGGLSVPVDTSCFGNDITSIRNKDDVLTLLIHLGYLAYHDMDETVRIPNEEIRNEFAKTICEIKSTDAIKRLQESRQLIQDTIRMDSDAVATGTESPPSSAKTALKRPS